MIPYSNSSLWQSQDSWKCSICIATFFPLVFYSSTHFMRWIFLAFIDKLEKQLFIKKLLSGPIKNTRILMFTMLYFFKKNKEKHLEISLFYTCIPKISIIWFTVPEIWSVTDWNWQFLFFFFAFLHPKNPKNQKFEKMKKLKEISSFHTCTKNHNHMMRDSWDIQNF